MRLLIRVLLAVESIVLLFPLLYLFIWGIQVLDVNLISNAISVDVRISDKNRAQVILFTYFTGIIGLAGLLPLIALTVLGRTVRKKVFTALTVLNCIGIISIIFILYPFESMNILEPIVIYIYGGPVFLSIHFLLVNINRSYSVNNTQHRTVNKRGQKDGRIH